MRDHFSIWFKQPPSYYDDARIGRIRIGEFEDGFAADLTYWRESEYEVYWRDALIAFESSDRVALITSIVDPRSAKFIRCWALYRYSETVFCQEQLVFLDQIQEAFDPACPQALVRPRETTNAEGQAISEWRTSMTAIRECMHRKRLDPTQE